MNTPTTLFVAFTILQLLDWYTTRTAIKSGKGKETNRFWMWAFDKIGMDLSLLIKTIVFSAFGYYLAITDIVGLDGGTFPGWYGLVFLNAYYVFMVILPNWRVTQK